VIELIFVIFFFFFWFRNSLFLWKMFYRGVVGWKLMDGLFLSFDVLSMLVFGVEFRVEQIFSSLYRDFFFLSFFSGKFLWKGFIGKQSGVRGCVLCDRSILVFCLIWYDFVMPMVVSFW
jgi:hypothetical protein